LGLLNFGSYWLVLWAFQVTLKASYIVAFRQFSIIIGVVLAFAIFKKERYPVRLAGALFITAGLVIIGLQGGNMYLRHTAGNKADQPGYPPGPEGYSRSSPRLRFNKHAAADQGAAALRATL